jgi:hypothetical protein
MKGGIPKYAMNTPLSISITINKTTYFPIFFTKVDWFLFFNIEYNNHPCNPRINKEKDL